MVPSADSCFNVSDKPCIVKCSSSRAKQSLFTFFMSAKCLTRFLYNQSQICSARNLCCPCLTNHARNCSNVNPKIDDLRSEEHTSELQSRFDLVCRLLLEKKKNQIKTERQTM